jgi:hypothetical protein
VVRLPSCIIQNNFDVLGAGPAKLFIANDAMAHEGKSCGEKLFLAGGGAL